MRRTDPYERSVLPFREFSMRTFTPTFAFVILLTSGCVVSETERGPGPGERKKESSTDHTPATDKTRLATASTTESAR